MQNIIRNILDAWDRDESVMLISIIQKSGSTPRGVGTQMLVGREGLIAGTVGGGAVEKDSIELAMKALEDGRSFTRNFELNLQDSSLNMVCGGALFLHFLYVDKADFEKDITAIDSMINRKETGFMVIDTVNNKLWFSNSAVVAENSVSIPLPVPDRVIIFGAGHVAQALVPVLSNVGFRCTVVDNRAEFIDKSMIPEAEAVILGDYEKIDDYVTITPKDYLIVMTHGHSHDFAVLERVLRQNHVYVGVMGSRRKKAFVNEKLRGAGIPEDRIEAIHSPIGLAIGAVTPEEIAISVAAELISVRAGVRRGGENS